MPAGLGLGYFSGGTVTPAANEWILNNDTVHELGTAYVWIDTSAWADAKVWKD